MTQSGTLIVLNKDEDCVWFINVRSGERLGSVPVGSNPHEVALTPDGTTAYVSNAVGNSISVLDVHAMEETGRIEHADFQFPHDIKISPEGKTMYVAVTYAHKVFVYRRETGEVLRVIATGQRLSHMLAPSPDWSRLYVPNLGSNTVSVLDTESLEIEGHLAVGKTPEGVGVHPSGRFLYVANQDDHDVMVFDTQQHGLIARIRVGNTPVRLVFSPDGDLAFTANRTSHDVSVIDTERQREIKRIPVGRWPGGIVFEVGGEWAYVANNKTNDISAIEVTSLKEVGRIDAGIHPDGIAWMASSPKTDYARPQSIRD